MESSKCVNLYLYLYLCLCFFSLCANGSLNRSSGDIKNIRRSHFPDGFFFGTSTSSYQIEGAFLEDGKSLSNWDVLTHSQGWSHKHYANGDVADNYYHLYSEDIDILHSLGVNAYRFSISWSRILPRGRLGEVNPSAVEFYDKIIDTLLLKGIEPFVNINHFDYPQELEDIYGSWLSPRMQDDFVYLAETCFKRFGDRVKHWITLNEPNRVTLFGYINGEWPPNRCSLPFGNCAFGNSQTEPLIVMHNMLLAHAKAADLYRRTFQNQGGVIGMTVSAKMHKPMRDEDELDHEAASRALAFDLAWVYDPLIFGDYPPEMRKYHRDELPEFSSEEKLLVKGSIDFIGINHYTTLYAKDCIFSTCPNGNTFIEGFTFISGYNTNGLPIGEPTGMMRFFVVPRGMEEMIEYLKERYNNNKPIFVFENGYAQTLQNTNVEDSIEDVKRVEFHKEYLASLARAIRNGADVRGYFVWSLMDNFEWVHEYTVAFGLYYVDRQTLERIPRLSAKWYKDFLTNDTRINPMDRLEFPLRKGNVAPSYQINAH